MVQDVVVDLLALLGAVVAVRVGGWEGVRAYTIDILAEDVLLDIVLVAIATAALTELIEQPLQLVHALISTKVLVAQ